MKENRPIFYRSESPDGFYFFSGLVIMSPEAGGKEQNKHCFFTIRAGLAPCLVSLYFFTTQRVRKKQGIVQPSLIW